MTRTEHDQLTLAQFDGQAQAYVNSSVHAQGEDLQEIAAFAAAMPGARILDLGCGGGHVAFTVAPHAAEVIAYDLSEKMLAAVAETAQHRKLTNISTQRGPAEKLPFADHSFDIVLTRFSAHHWLHVQAGIAEARRVLRPQGKALFADVVAPEQVVCDTFLQTIEMLRDPSHVRDYSVSQWHGYLQQAGFNITKTTTRRLQLEFQSWLTRMQTPEVRSAAIRSLQTVASQEILAHFEIEPTGTFTCDTATIQAV